MILKIQVLLLIVFLPLSLLAQADTNCQKLLHQYQTVYYEKKYQEALTTFQKAETCDKNLSPTHYYNGCCIASLAQNEQLAFEYLKKAIDKGWENIAHMNKDSDLDFIRNKSQYLRLVDQIKSKYDYLIQYFKLLEQEDYDMAVPYCINNKWGLVHKKTQKKITEPIFDYIDFRCKKNIPFVYKGESFTLIENLKVNKNTEKSNERMYSLSSDSKKTFSTDSTINGFVILENKITTISNKYLSVTLIKGLNWGIATRKDGVINIITANGNRVDAFNEDYKEFKTHLLSWSNYLKPDILFSNKKIGEKTLSIFDKNGKKLINQSFESVESFSNLQNTPLNNQIIVGNMAKKFLKVKIGEKYNVFYMQANIILFENDYGDIVMINGPTSDIDKSLNAINEGISDPYFLIKEGNNYYYIGLNGKVYKPE